MASLIERFDEPLLPRTLSGVRSWPIAALRQRPLWVDSRHSGLASFARMQFVVNINHVFGT